MTALATSQNWEVASADAGDVARIVRHTGVSELVARILAGRGATGLDEVDRFLHPSFERDWEDPYSIPGLAAVVEFLYTALTSHKRIAVFGDFDVDGITATCLMTSALRQLGGDVVPFIPRRFGEGYGLSAASLTRLISQSSPDVIVTVDTGIAGSVEVAGLLERGYPVAVTDHHEPGGFVPQGIPVCDPKLDPDCPSFDLAGVGVALKVVCALGAGMGQPDLWKQYLDLASLGTVSDLMELGPENRWIVLAGTTQVRHSRRPGIIALADQAGRDLHSMSSDELAYSLIPRLNAAGRMADPMLSLQVLMAQSPQEAEELAIRLEAINQQRRSTEAELTQAAMSLVNQTFHDGHVIVVGGEGWHEGVKGIVASRLVAQYRVPALLFTIDGTIARGSGRSVGSIDLFHMVEQCSDVLIRFGGHAGAVGITLETARLDDFRARMEALLAAVPPEDFTSKRKVAAQVGLDELSTDSIASLEVMQPFGQGNPVPLLAVCGVSMVERHRRGEGGKHLSFSLSDGLSERACIMFNPTGIENLASYDGAVDAVFEPKVETWRGRTSVKLHIRDILMRTDEKDGQPQVSTSRLVDDLFARADEFTREEELTDIAQAMAFHTHFATLRTPEVRAVMESMVAGQKLKFVPQLAFPSVTPGSAADGAPTAIAPAPVPDLAPAPAPVPAPVPAPGSSAALAEDTATAPDGTPVFTLNVTPTATIAVYTQDGVHLGYLRRVVADAIGPNIAHGAYYRARVLSVSTPVHDEESHHITMLVERLLPHGNRESVVATVHKYKQERERLVALDQDSLTRELTRELIGGKELLPAQAQALRQLAAGQRTLCIMATGRGKSLIFYVHAARTAIAHRHASIFVYPLRALVSDQSYHLQTVFEKLGLQVRVLTGETPFIRRRETLDSYAAGDVDILLTTPEFLAMHTDAFARNTRCGFVVVDEAHHAGTAASADRPAYLELPRVLEALGQPAVLAVTATASTEVAEDICGLLQISRSAVVVDASVRGNLHVVDTRGLAARKRSERLVNLLAEGGKTLVYVNSRDQSVALARLLRQRVWEQGHKVAFYNGGLTRPDRQAVEEAFRAGSLSLVVATSAFGEGVNLPDVRNVVLYHLPFDAISFNQMSGRAGRDGKDAWVHLQYGSTDAQLNEQVLRKAAPPRASLVAVYQALIGLHSSAEQSGYSAFAASNAQIAAAAMAINPKAEVDPAVAGTALAVFCELGLSSVRGYGQRRRISMVSNPGHMNLLDSVRYREGLRAYEAFEAYRHWALDATADAILEHIKSPITPEGW